MKKSLYPPGRIAGILKALGHSTRISMIRLLATGGKKKLSVSQIQVALGLEQVETSRHLILLKNASILNCERSGTNSYYSINYADGFVKQAAHILTSDIS